MPHRVHALTRYAPPTKGLALLYCGEINMVQEKEGPYSDEK